MEIKLKITSRQAIIVVLLVAIAFAGGFLLNQKETVMPMQCETYTGFTDKDLNILGNLAYSQGFCERLGLVSNVIIQDFNGVPYGVPICTNKLGEQ